MVKLSSAISQDILAGKDFSIMPREIEILINQHKKGKKDIVEKKLSVLTDAQREVFILYYFNGKNIKEISEIIGKNFSSTWKILEKTKDALTGSKNSNKEEPVNKNINITNMVQLKPLQDVRVELAKREKFVDFEKEVRPKLTEIQEKIFDSYMQSSTGENQKQIAKRININESSVSRIINEILDKIDGIIERKKAREKTINELGGKEFLDEIKLLLDESQRDILDQVILSTEKYPHANYLESHDISSNLLSSDVREIKKLIATFLENKRQSEEFINNNGGEDFLINEFGSTLCESLFDVMLTIMMDYHYLSDRSASLTLGMPNNYVHNARSYILSALEEYKKRKKEVDTLISNAGGEEKVSVDYYSKLDEIHKAIFEDTILAYYPLTYSEVAEKLGIDLRTVSKYSKEMLSDLENMAQNLNNAK